MEVVRERRENWTAKIMEGGSLVEKALSGEMEEKDGGPGRDEEKF